MQRSWIALAGLALLATTVCCQERPPGNVSGGISLTTTGDQASYALGLNIGRSLKNDGLEVNTEALAQGIKDVFANAQPRLTNEQCQAALLTFQREMSSKLEARRLAMGEKNKREGQAFLTANGSKAAVVTLPSGLQYQVLKNGSGPSPKLSDTIRAHYHGTLIDGTIFDSSVQRGQAAEFPVGGVIRGWTEALQKMKVGGKWRLFVPSELAYGPQGTPDGTIGPHAVLIFDVELLGIK